MVRDTGFEPVTPAVSRQCSTTELTARVRRRKIHFGTRQAIEFPPKKRIFQKAGKGNEFPEREFRRHAAHRTGRIQVSFSPLQ